MKELLGSGVALVTPFDETGKVDYDSLASLIEYQIQGGIDYLVSLGTTGEASTLSEQEKQAIWSFTSEQVRNRIPLIAGLGSSNTTQIVSELRDFDLTGYQAILSVSPYYNKPTQEGIFQHYAALSNASPLPIILYNVPSRTGSNISPETTIRLAKGFTNIVGIKEASGSFDQFVKILKDKPDSFSLISGDDPITLPMMSMGAAGVISVIGNAYPGLLSEMVRLCDAENYHSARPIQLSLLNITSLCFIDGNPAGVKYILKELGIIKNDFVRLPLAPVTTETKAAVRKEINLLSLLE